jgi:hypothetical protein
MIWPGEPPPAEHCANGMDDDGDGLIDCVDPDCALNPACGSAKENCSNAIDDDGDGFVDCQDPDCKGAPGCSTKPERCDNFFDDDGDGLVDCNDPDCFAAPECQSNPELCGNGIDDDGDGLVDCQDPQCFGFPGCQPKPEDCTNGVDDDGDTLVDCNDPDCAGAPGCVANPEICDNNFDDDGDGLVDCADPQCFSAPHCQTKKEICTNKVDDDGNGLVDCQDPACKNDPACGTKVEICNNGLDDDGNGKVDCEDFACNADPSCAVKQEDCTNQIDDDKDLLVDCDDPDCFKHPKCKVPGKEVCNNGVDDDEDLAIDCADSDCANLPICLPGKEICDNKIDDDKDGAIDCGDPDCKSFPGCSGVLCKATVDFGTIAPKGGSVQKTITTTGQKDVYTSTCVVPGGGEVVARFALSAKTDLKLEYEQLAGDSVFALFLAGVGEACNANSRGCFDPKSAPKGSFSLKSLDAGVYYLIVEAFAKGLEGQVKVTLSTGSPGGPEVCNNGIDDDGDLAIDCADLDCVLTPGCATALCKVDVNLGTLVVNGPSKHTNVSTATGPSLYDLTCSAGGGKERIVRFAMPTAAGLAITVMQTGWHTFGLHSDMGPGTKCNADKGSCFDSNKSPGFTLVYDDVEKGVYYYIVDALKPGSEGTVDLTFQAFANRGPELCANKIDDDGDGLVDCMDPDCTGVVGCPGPVCIPDLKTGPLAPGSPGVSFKIDTAKANNDQTVPCALGGGKDTVIEVTLTQVSGLELNCQQYGSSDHVFGLFSTGDPRDPCDKNAANCADPKIGPLSCHFIMPNLQPGKYYLVVEAFKPGAEGVMDLQLAATPDHAQEICNNGIDDDGDTKIDCQDSNCSSKPICQGKTCTPDQKLGLIPANGTPVNAAATTLGGTDKTAAACAQGGGADVVLGFTLVNPANLTVEFAQFGNHVLALHDNKGAGFACDAAPLACQPTQGQPMGKVSFSGLKAGEYYLVVEANSASSEGSAVLKLTAN